MSLAIFHKQYLHAVYRALRRCPIRVQGNHIFDIAREIDMALAWSSQLIFDAVVFVLTVWKSYYIGKLGVRLLVDILLRDGVYFIVDLV